MVLMTFEFHFCRGFLALLLKRDSYKPALWYPPGNSSRTDHGSCSRFAGDYGMSQRLRPLFCFLISALLAVCSTGAIARANHKPQHAKKPHEASGARHHRNAAHEKAGHAKRSAAKERESARSSAAPPASVEASPLSADLAAVKNAIDLARKAKTTEATAIQKTIADPAARKLVEWFILRYPDADANFSRYAAFIADNPGWPSMKLMQQARGGAPVGGTQRRRHRARFRRRPADKRQRPLRARAGPARRRQP